MNRMQTDQPYPPAAGYVPYFYQSGLFQWRPLPTAQAPSKTYSGAPATYDFTSDLIRKPSYSHGPSIEQIIERGYLSAPRSDPETALITDKQQTAWLGVDDLISQVKRRQEIYQRNVYDLDLAKCSASSSLFSIIAQRGGQPASPREVYSVQKRFQELYREQREERVSLWQDISRLKLAFPEVAQQYLSAYRKLAILADPTGEPS